MAPSLARQAKGDLTGRTLAMFQGTFSVPLSGIVS